MSARGLWRWLLGVCLASVGLPGGVQPALASALTVAPVSITMAPDQMTTTLTLSNSGGHAVAFQVRAFAWDQQGGGDHLAATDVLQFSPPLGTLAAGADQVVRLLLRSPAQGAEASYRILIDQIPPPASPGTVSVVLRLSIPVFAEPAGRVSPDLHWRLDREANHWWLVAVNSGGRHEAVRNLALRTADGSRLKVENGALGYVLAGATRRWDVVLPAAAPALGTVLQLSAQTDHGPIDVDVPVAVAKP